MKDYNAENNRAVWFDISVADLDRAQNFYEPVLIIKIFRDKYNDFEFCVLDHEKCNGGCLIPNPNEILADKGIMVYLVDSGGQYLDGTTDITRTVAIGSPIDFTKKAFTLVLKGHIALVSAQFPEGILDTLARQFLWHEGLDFDHGTGHGVGSSLNVYEGPHRIGKGSNKVPLKEGMVVSNEPGYYEEG